MPAAAQPASPAYSWTGWYIGGNAGYAFGQSNIVSLFTCPNPGNCAYTDQANRSIAPAGTGALTPRGLMAGVQGGYNWQTGNFVMGVEADVGALRLRTTRSVPGVPKGEAANNFAVTVAVESTWVSTLRGRFGWIVTPTTLLYATGGLAVTNFKVSNSFLDDASTILGQTADSTGASSASQRKLGWTFGGGLEWALFGNWTLRAEYLYYNFGSLTTTARVLNTSIAPDDPNLLATKADLRASITRLGLNWRF